MLAHGLQQSDRPGKTRCVELERIGRVAGHAAHDQVDRHQAVQRLERHAVAGDAQVAAFHQQQPEIAGEIGVAEEVVVARPGRQQRDGRVGAIGAPGERRLQLLKERRQPHRLARREDIAGDIGVHHAVGERIADAGRGLGMRVDHAPAPVGSARDVGGEELEEPARRLQAMAGPQEGRIAEHELMREWRPTPADAAARRGRRGWIRTGARAE